MYKATKDLIKSRQIFSPYPIKQVFVKRTNSGVPNDCFHNAISTMNEKSQISVVSGWIVWKFDPNINKTVINQHFWNSNLNGDFFDTTPLPNVEFEYVIDMDISVYGQKNHQLIKSNVCYSLLYIDGEYWAYEEIEGKAVNHKIDNLSNKNIFKFK